MSHARPGSPPDGPMHGFGGQKKECFSLRQGQGLALRGENAPQRHRLGRRSCPRGPQGGGRTHTAATCVGSVHLEGLRRPLAGDPWSGLGRGPLPYSLNPLLRDQEMHALLWSPNQPCGPNRLRLLPLHLPLHGPHIRRNE